MSKTKKELAKEMLTRAKEEVLGDEIMEQYFQRKVISGSKVYEQALGQTQAKIKEKREIIKFLEEVFQ